MSKIDLAGKLHDARARVDAEDAPDERELAKFARLTRKDARVRAEQDAALTALAKTLMRCRRVKAERITENTLIRVAIDLLLAHADELRGSTEEELRNSVTSTVPYSQTSDTPEFQTPGVQNIRTPDAATSFPAGLRESAASALSNSRTSADAAPFAVSTATHALGVRR